MISILWLFIGCIVGLLVVSVFNPPIRPDMNLPTPNCKTIFHTKSGCVKFKTNEVDCNNSIDSLNILASEHK